MNFIDMEETTRCVSESCKEAARMMFVLSTPSPTFRQPPVTESLVQLLLPIQFMLSGAPVLDSQSRYRYGYSLSDVFQVSQGIALYLPTLYGEIITKIIR